MSNGALLTTMTKKSAEAIDRLTSMWCSAELDLKTIHFVEDHIEALEAENAKMRKVVEAVSKYLRIKRANHIYDLNALEKLVVDLNDLQPDRELEDE